MRSAASRRSWPRSPGGSRSAWACRRRSARTIRCSTGSATQTSRRSASSSQLAESQLGTVGSGNHYVNLMEDERGQDLGRRPLRLARLRPQDGVGLPRARAGPAVRRQGDRGRDGLAAGAVRGRLRARRVVRRGDGAGGRVRLRRPRHRRRQGARDPRRRRRSTRCTTTTTSRGGRSTSAAPTGWSGRAARRRGRARRASSAARWATSR